MSKTNSSNRADVRRAAVLSNPRFRALAAWALVFVGLLVLYSPALQGQFLWDDTENITRPELRSWQGLERIWFQWGATQTYYPVLHTLYWIEQKLWGDATLGYHVASILFHSISVCLLYGIVRRLKIPGALLAAALFAVHPVYVESIAWITEQKNTLSGMFTLASLLAYLHFDDSRRRGTYAWALALFLLALESKATAVTLPVALVVMLWWKRGALSWRRDLVPLVPWFALSLLVGVFTVWYEKVYVGVQGEQFVLSTLQKVLLASRAVWFYLGKLFWPSHLILIYPRWEIDAAQAWQYLYLIGCVTLLGVACAVHRSWRAPLAALLFFLGTLFPLLGFFPTYIFSYTYVCDHFQYLPSLGIVVLVSAGVALVLRRLAPPARHIGQGLCAAVLAVLALLTWQQCQMYGDKITLYQATLALNPTCWMAHNNLGLELVKIGQPLSAMEHYQQALAIRPDYPEAHNNLGIELRNGGKVRESIDQFQQALLLRPTYLDAHINLGIAYVLSRQLPSAIEEFKEATRINPNSAEAFNNLGCAVLDSGRLEEAIDYFKQAVALRPSFLDAHFNLGHALRQSARFDEALQQYYLALQISPNDPAIFAMLTKTYAEMNRPADAIATAEKALQAARSQGRTELVQQIETWLANYRSQQSKP